MKRKPTKKENLYLREIVGEDGNKAHYYPPDLGAAKRQRSARAAAQVAQMREAAALKLPAV